MKKDTAQILGVFSTPEDTTTALASLKKAGVEKIALYSPFDPEEADIPVPKMSSPVGWFTAVGAIFGTLSGIAFTVGTAMLYPVETGGMPVLSLPAIAILSFDFMLLFAILFTIAGFLYCSFFKGERRTGLPNRFSRDRFGISISGNEKVLASAREVLKKVGTDKLGKQVSQVFMALFVISLLPAQVFAWPWTEDMVHQPVRKAQSAEITVLPSAVSRQRMTFEVTDKAQAPGITNPTDLTPESLKRGKMLYDRFCTLCHGSEGKGDGIIAEKIGELPDFTEAAFRNQPDGCIYFAITNGSNFRKAVFPSEAFALEALDEGGGHEHGHEEEHSHGDPLFAEEEQEHAHDEGLTLEDEHSHGDPIFVKEEHGHSHDEGLTLEDEHSHGDPMFAEEEHGHGGMKGEDDGHAHSHAGGNECNSGHVHAPGEGHGDGEESHGAGGDDEHGSKKKHFMPPHRDAILLIDRWHIVNYMKHELGQ